MENLFTYIVYGESIILLMMIIMKGKKKINSPEFLLVFLVDFFLFYPSRLIRWQERAFMEFNYPPTWEYIEKIWKCNSPCERMCANHAIWNKIIIKKKKWPIQLRHTLFIIIMVGISHIIDTRRKKETLTALDLDQEEIQLDINEHSYYIF